MKIWGKGFLTFFKIRLMLSKLFYLMNKTTNSDYITREEVKEMIDDALRRHNRRSTIISSVLGWILIGGYSFGLFTAIQNV